MPRIVVPLPGVGQRRSGAWGQKCGGACGTLVICPLQDGQAEESFEDCSNSSAIAASARDAASPPMVPINTRRLESRTLRDHVRRLSSWAARSSPPSKRRRLPVVAPLFIVFIVGFGGRPAPIALLREAEFVVENGLGGNPNPSGADAVLRAEATSSASDEAEWAKG